MWYLRCPLLKICIIANLLLAELLLLVLHAFRHLYIVADLCTYMLYVHLAGKVLVLFGQARLRHKMKAPESSACGTMCTAPMWVFTKQPWSKVMVLLSAMKSTQLNGHGDTHRKLFLAKALPSNHGAGCSMGTQRPARRPIHRLRPLFHTICVKGFR